MQMCVKKSRKHKFYVIDYQPSVNRSRKKIKKYFFTQIKRMKDFNL